MPEVNGTCPNSQGFDQERFCHLCSRRNFAHQNVPLRNYPPLHRCFYGHLIPEPLESTQGRWVCCIAQQKMSRGALRCREITGTSMDLPRNRLRVVCGIRSTEHFCLIREGTGFGQPNLHVGIVLSGPLTHPPSCSLLCHAQFVFVRVSGLDVWPEMKDCAGEVLY